MPDAAGNIRGIATTGKAGEKIEEIFGPKLEAAPERECEWCPGVEATHEICGAHACIDCWEKAYGLD